MKQILAATDLSSRSEHALRRAALLNHRYSGEWRILHVVDDDQPPKAVERARRQAEELLKRTVETLAGTAGGRPALEIRAGDPFEEIVRAAAEGGADLVVMGEHRRRVLRDVFVGTTVERVMRTGHHPVLMVSNDPKGPYRRAMAAVDMSEASANALKAAHALGLFDGVHVSLLHAFDPLAKAMMIYANIERERIEEYVAQEAAETRRNLEDFLSRIDLGKTSLHVQLVEGQPFATIARAVEQDRPELLIIGTRGLTGPKRVLLGSVADAVLRSVTCDVLAVPPPADTGSTALAAPAP